MTDPMPRRVSLAARMTASGLLAGCALLVIGCGGVASTTADASDSAPPPPIKADPVLQVTNSGAEFPENWYYPDRKTGKRYAAPKTLEGKPAPALKLKDWVGTPVSMEALKGKVVVIDFWATWCPPCRAALPENIEMVKKYSKDEFAIVGIHDARRGFERMPAMAQAVGLNYPTAVDDGGFSTRAWKVGFWPTYAVVDHNGVVRASGLFPHKVKDVVERLLAERDREI